MDETENNELLTKTYIKLFRKGRGRAAHVFDTAALVVLIFIIVWLTVRSRISNNSVVMLAASIITAVVTVILKITEEIRFKRFIAVLRKKIGSRLAKQKAILNYSSICSRIKENGVFVCRSIEALTANDVVSAVNAGCDTIVSIAKATETADELIKLSGIKLSTPFDYLDSPAEDLFRIEDEEIDRAILKNNRTIEKRGLKALAENLADLSRERAMRYVFTGFALFILSFFVGFRLYYRLFGSVALAIGSIIMSIDSHRDNRMQESKAPSDYTSGADGSR